MLKNVWTDGPMDGPTDRPRCRVACKRLKMNRKGNKPNRATMRPSCALSGGNFGVVTGFIDKSLKYIMRYCGSKLYQQIILIML